MSATVRRPDQQLPVDQDRRVGAAAVKPLRVRLSRGPQPSAAGRLGTPEAGGDACRTRRPGTWLPGHCRSLRCCGPAAPSARPAAEPGWPAVFAAGPPRGHGHGVDAAHGAGAAGPERAQHTLTPRAGHVPGQQGLLGPLEARHDDHSARLHSCRPALPTTCRRRRSRLMLQRANSHHAPSPNCRRCQRSATGDDRRPNRATDLGSHASRRCDDADEPSQSTPVYASPVTTNPRFIGIRGGVQHARRLGAIG